jgi:transposase InsO family protein
VGAFPLWPVLRILAAARLRYIAGSAWSTKRYMNSAPSMKPSSYKPEPSPDQMCERIWTLPRIKRLLRQQALKARPRRPRLPPDLDERQASAVAPKVLDRGFEAPAPNRNARKLNRTRDEARADVFDYIELFYNRKRRHSTIGYLSPMEFEQRVVFA